MNNPSTRQSQDDEVCSHAKSCNLYPILAASSSLAYWTRTYCKGNYRRCARYIRIADGLAVAPSLLPNGKKL